MLYFLLYFLHLDGGGRCGSGGGWNNWDRTIRGPDSKSEQTPPHSTAGHYGAVGLAISPHIFFQMIKLHQSCCILQSRKKGVALVMASYLEDAEVHLPPVSIRLTASTLLTGDDIRIAGKTVLAVCREIFEGKQQVGWVEDQMATVDLIPD